VTDYCQIFFAVVERMDALQISDTIKAALGISAGKHYKLIF